MDGASEVSTLWEEDDLREDDQIWAPIPEFPDYQVSNYGLVWNSRQRRTMQLSRTNHGHVKVSLVNREGRFTRSVALLVAQAFVPAPDRRCDTPILLDCDLTNVAADNIAWRPDWFAWKYTRQFKIPQPLWAYNLQVDNAVTGARYPSIAECCKAEGLLFDDVWRSTYKEIPVYPSQCTYVITERV